MGATGGRVDGKIALVTGGGSGLTHDVTGAELVLDGGLSSQ